MFCARVIPAFGIQLGRVVRGRRGGTLEDAGHPVDVALRYEREGADELFLCDTAGTPEGRRSTLRVVEALRSHLRIPFTIGGGIRKTGHALALLEAGADKIALSRAAVVRPALLDELVAACGSAGVMLSIGVQRGAWGFEVAVPSGTHWTRRDAIEWAAEAETRGVGEILLTSLDTQPGQAYDVPLLKAVTDTVRVPVIAAGAARSNQFDEALAAGASAVLATSWPKGRVDTVSATKAELWSAGVEIRR